MKSRAFYIDAAAVFLCCVIVAVTFLENNTVQVILTSVIGMSFLIISGGKKLYAAEIIFPVLTLFAAEGIAFIPAVLYSCALNRHKVPAVSAAVLLMIGISRNGAADVTGFAAALSVLSAALGFRSGELTLRNNELIKMRDNDTELELKLRGKNKELLQKQDYEINLATLKERNRIAREIHDNVGHLLSRAILQSGALLAITDKEKLPVQYDQVSALKETLGLAMDSIRESVHGLRDDSINLHNAVKEAADVMKGRFKVVTELDFSEKMPAEVKLCFISVIKEALSNSAKHSSGDEIHIIIREHPALFQLYVTDNGTAVRINQNGGMGLNNMRERAEALGGIFRTDTSNGFRIFISVKRNTEEKGNEDSGGR